MPAKSATAKGLREQRKAAGLDATGTKDPRGLLPESQDAIGFDAVLAARSEAGWRGRDARDTLGQALQEDELFAGSLGLAGTRTSRRDPFARR